MALNDETNGGGMVMPVAPLNNSNSGGFGFGDNGWWIILLFILLGGWGNGFGGGFNGSGDLYPWMNQSNQINGGFRDQMLGSQLTGIQNAVTGGFSDVQQALCAGFAGVNAGIANGFAQAEIAANARQIADMQQAFAAQTATMQGFNGVQSQLAQCCCDNRAGIADLRYTVATEACADRNAISSALRDVLAANTASTQRILDQLCQDKIDAKNDTIAQLRQELIFARGQASQDVQTAELRASNATTANQLISELRSCPIPAQPVYGAQPIFTCPTTATGCGCGCGA